MRGRPHAQPALARGPAADAARSSSSCRCIHLPLAPPCTQQPCTAAGLAAQKDPCWRRRHRVERPAQRASSTRDGEEARKSCFRPRLAGGRRLRRPSIAIRTHGTPRQHQRRRECRSVPALSARLCPCAGSEGQGAGPSAIRLASVAGESAGVVRPSGQRAVASAGCRHGATMRCSQASIAVTYSLTWGLRARGRAGASSERRGSPGSEGAGGWTRRRSRAVHPCPLALRPPLTFMRHARSRHEILPAAAACCDLTPAARAAQARSSTAARALALLGAELQVPRRRCQQAPPAMLAPDAPCCSPSPHLDKEMQPQRHPAWSAELLAGCSAGDQVGAALRTLPRAHARTSPFALRAPSKRPPLGRGGVPPSALASAGRVVNNRRERARHARASKACGAVPRLREPGVGRGHAAMTASGWLCAGCCWIPTRGGRLRRCTWMPRHVGGCQALSAPSLATLCGASFRPAPPSRRRCLSCAPRGRRRRSADRGEKKHAPALHPHGEDGGSAALPCARMARNGLAARLAIRSAMDGNARRAADVHERRRAASAIPSRGRVNARAQARARLGGAHEQR
ncbi:hypothetical protein FA09DRAFT_112212 [Tilletiopsis washingtonensis]|uniref:Uncharacterized protein n=1 Tax=Tilletiopsis washingtonensis TaxID=58919 RepID=A0A316ZIA6_9BASI|nr:hypothetical protein FA09DRAFT_112212 [Tilletiopsis washingtonensis]PWO00745.1 hypothetical protein FA09DRAFT_112212 [Tilletiopsis washingtonensis]